MRPARRDFLYAAAAFVDLAQSARAGRGRPLRLLVPAYFYPAGEGLRFWDRLLESAPKALLTAIVNPANGPGRDLDPNYADLLARARKTRIELLGYVHTSYTKRPVMEVKADVDRWAILEAGPQGIFVDEQPSGAEALPYYEELYRHIRSKPGFRRVVTNPGTSCAEAFLKKPASDMVCLFEGLLAADEWRLPEWSSKYRRDRVAVLAYGVLEEAGMERLVRLARAQEIGCLYVTDRSSANPWDGLPAYWERLVELARG